MIRKQTMIWTTATGKRVRICDMTASHLRNTIAFVERTAHAQWSEELNAAYNCLSMFNGEAAIDHCESAILQMEMDGPLGFLDDEPLYASLLLERDRRGGTPAGGEVFA